MVHRVSGLTVLLAAVLAPALQAQDQHAMAVEGHFQGFSFEDGASLQTVNVLLLPVGYRLPFNDRVVLDLYGAWGRGQVESSDRTYQLEGLVDTQAKLRLQATPWALLTVSASLPTGNAKHDAEEAVVAGVLSSDLFGFRESVWGNGFGLTTGVATATRLGTLGVGFGASYRIAGEFEPDAEDNVGYQPGSEMRVRLGVDHQVGQTGKVTVGYTFQNFAEDQSNGRNFFQAGKRHLVDGTMGFRLAGQVWNVYGMYLNRERGDLTLQILDAQQQPVGDTLLATASQKLYSGGVTGAFSLGSSTLRTSADIRMVDRADPEGSDEGSGWIAGFGVELPLRVGARGTLLPSARVMTGGITDVGGADRSLTGFEGGLILRIELGG
jgi:hypothetical protein